MTVDHLYAVIMAGGRGERFWPLSTQDLPKPFVSLLGDRSMIRETLSRLDPLIPPERALIAIGPAQEEAARRQLPEVPRENIIIEPVGRDTSACLGLCALHLERRDSDAVMLALPADHYIADAAAYRRTMQLGLDCLEGATGVIFGIVPVRPETGYGYILAEKPALPARGWPVLRFVEKPDAAKAAEYLRSGNYFWNSGMFLWRNQTLLALFRKYMPALSGGLDSLRPLLGRPDRDAEALRIFSGLQRISIDFGILEKASGLRLVPIEFEWDDIGNWASLARALPRDAGENAGCGPRLLLESTGCVTYSDSGTVALFAVRDLVVVQACGNVLVCPKDRAADLKRLVALL